VGALGRVQRRLGLGPAPRTLGDRGRVSGDHHGPQQVRVEDEVRVAPAGREPAQRAHQQQEQLARRLPLLRGEPVRGLEQRAPRRVAGVVDDEVAAERVEGLDLGDDVEAAPGVQLQVDVAERFEPGPELRRRPADALRGGADLAVPVGEQRDDPVRLAELLAPEDHSGVAVEAHAPHPGTSRHRRPAGEVRCALVSTNPRYSAD
jgi:hypothetical protein